MFKFIVLSAEETRLLEHHVTLFISESAIEKWRLESDVLYS